MLNLLNLRLMFTSLQLGIWAATLPTFGHSAAAADIPVPGTVSVVKSAKIAKFISKGSYPLPAPGTADDPTLNGATLRFFDVSPLGAGAVAFTLDATGWTGLGNPARSKGYRYKGRDDIADSEPKGTCKVVVITDTRIKAVCKGQRVEFSLPFLGNQGVVLETGSMNYCAELGGETKRNDDKTFKRQNAPAPLLCPREATPTPTQVSTATETSTPAESDTPTATATITQTPTAAETASPSPTFTGGLGSQVCTLQSQQSRLFLQLGATGVLIRPAGSIAIDCGAQGAGGQSPCTCEVLDFAAINLLGIGDVCVDPAGPCPAGAAYCNGGSPIDVNLLGDHNIGTCTNQASCASSCTTQCAAMGTGYRVFDSGCEGFCVGGANHDMVCGQDADCPDGTCPGKEPSQLGPHAGVCNCACINTTLGSPAPAGSMACNLGLEITIERDQDLICGNTVPSILLPPLCGALTTANAKGLTLHANNGTTATARLPPGRNSAPLNADGAPKTCQQFASGAISGLKFAGYLQFYDSTLGDILAQEEFICQ